MTAPDPGADPFLAPPLDADQLGLLRRYGQEGPTTAGQVLFREGDPAYDFIVVLSGAVSVIDHQAGVVRELATLGPGRFVAELNILTGERVFATAVVREPGSVLVVPVDRLHEVIAQDQQLSNVIVQVILRRRQWFLQQRAPRPPRRPSCHRRRGPTLTAHKPALRRETRARARAPDC